jgi:hypothetical protein
MNLKDKMEKFNKRWNITQSETPEESFSKFKTRILNLFKDIDSHLSEESISEFCQFYGITEEWKHDYLGTQKWSRNVINRLTREQDGIEFYKLLEIIFTLNILTTGGYHSWETSYSKDILFRDTIQALNYSNLDVELQRTNNGEIIFYPKGELELDQELVNSPLSFLSEKSSEHFIEALKLYQTNKPVKSAESLRRSIEEFLRNKLGNQKGLNANISEMQIKLKSDGRDSQVRNIVGTTLNYLDQYFNENSKHNDGAIDDSENEFLIYQTGLLMRYINRNI